MTGKTSTPFDRPGSVPWPPLLLALAIIAAIAMGRVWPLGWPGLDDGAARIVGFGIGIAGLLLTAWALATLHHHDTTIMPDQPAVRLVTDGPYRYRRNPIYLGEVLMMFGAAELTKNIWFGALALVFAIVVTVLQIIPEERHLEARFGDQWRDYVARTRRWI